MKGFPWRLASCWAVIGVCGAAASAQAPAGAPVAWVQVAADCPVGPEEVETGQKEEAPQVVACGGAGTFFFGSPGLGYGGICPALGGTEVPSPIPVEPAPSVPQAFSCLQGDCLGHSPGKPWVAMLDWPTAHGWSVAATIREAADQRVGVELYDLTAAGTLAQWAPAVSDLHVLVQLCAVAEAAREHPRDRPLAVNMSFGRRRTGADCTPSTSSLGCAVSRVLSTLAAEGIVPVAAAGNHHELLFPASSTDVVSAGALDLAYLEGGGEPRASTQTPPAAEALMLGYGIYLPLPAVDGENVFWPAPPGSSYAAALLTGWLSGTLAGGGELPDPLPKSARWTPVATATGLALALDGAPLPGSELQGPRLLLERAVGEAPIPREREAIATLQLTGPAPPLPELSVLYAEDGNVPQPGVNPCVPCQGDREVGDAGSSGSVVVDLSSSGGMPPGADLVGVFLRVGQAVYMFDGSRDPDVLAAITAGDLGGLELSEVNGIFHAGEQPSLLFVLNVGGATYWHEVPVNLPQ